MVIYLFVSAFVCKAIIFVILWLIIDISQSDPIYLNGLSVYKKTIIKWKCSIFSNAVFMFVGGGN